MTEEYDKQGYLKGSGVDATKGVTWHAVRVMLDDHDYECLTEEAKDNHRVPSKQLSHQISLRYKKKRLKRID